MCGVGRQGHRIYTTHEWPGRNTHPHIEGTQQAPHGRQQAIHSRAAESGADPDACVVLGERKQSRLVRGAHASIAGQHHTSGQQGHRIYTTWLAGTHIRATRAQNYTPDMAGQEQPAHPRIEGTQQAPHGRQQADHSPAAEIGGIQMHVWGRTKEHNAGQSEGHMPA